MKIGSVLLFCVLGFGVCGNVVADLNNGLIAFYPFDGNANDESGNNNHGVIAGNTSLIADRFGDGDKAYNFDGDGDYISIDNVKIISFSSSSLSVWFNPSSSNDSQWGRGIYVENGVNNYSKYNLGAQNGELYFFGRTQATTDDFRIKISDLVIGYWNHIVITYENKKLMFYLNGELVGSHLMSSLFYDDVVSTSIGTQSGSSSTTFIGSIDDLRLYNRSLSESEIKELYNLSSSSDCWATYENGSLHIPCVKVRGAFGEELKYEADMQYEPLSNPMTFELTGAKQK